MLNKILLLEEKGSFSVVIQVYTSLQLQYKSGKMKSWHSQCCFINLSSATVLFFPAIHRFLYFRFCICRFDQNRSKSIKINHNRTKSIITRNCVIDFYPFSIFVDWFVSTMIDNNRILSTIGIIDMLRPDDKLTLQAEYISLRKCSIVIKVIYL